MHKLYMHQLPTKSTWSKGLQCALTAITIVALSLSLYIYIEREREDAYRERMQYVPSSGEKSLRNSL